MMRKSEGGLAFECVCGFTVSYAQIMNGRPDPNRAARMLEKNK
jgi:hypothetical protein